jgi:hypothetical protein
MTKAVASAASPAASAVSGRRIERQIIDGVPSHEERKDFFFEKKKQKTFGHLASALPERLGPGFKSFLVLFFKKELLSFFPYGNSLSPPQKFPCRA